MDLVCKVAVLAIAAGLVLATPGAAHSASLEGAGPEKPAARTPESGMKKAQAALPIRSRAALDTYLRDAADKGQATPLDRLSPGARIRFLGTLEFSKSGAARFPYSEFPEELDETEIHGLLALFGKEDMAEYYPAAKTADPSTSTYNASADQLSDFERRFNRFYFYSTKHADESESESAQATRLQQQLVVMLPEIVHPEAIARLGNHDLRLLFRATGTAAFHATNPHIVGVLEQAFQSMDRRGIASENDIRLIYHQLLRVRRFDQARRFADSHPGVELARLPTLHDALPASDMRPSVWVMAADGQSMRRTPVDLGPLQILVMAGCHFSEDAAKAITGDPVLGPVFRDHARWLMQPLGREKAADVAEWNRKYPSARADMIYDRNQWDMLGRWVMPAYVIVKDGKVLAQANGWPPNPDRQHLIDILKKAGFALGDAAAPPNQTSMAESSSTAAN